METQKATFGAGCFWGVEETFRRLKGVTDTAVGYAGGTKENPTYEDVCTDETGHAEVVQVEFDPAKISYPELLDVFWANHNPTTLNRQGPDVGTQYRSVIFYHSPEQKAAAEESKAALEKSGRFKRDDRHSDRTGAEILSGRRISPALPGKARPIALRDLMALESSACEFQESREIIRTKISRPKPRSSLCSGHATALDRTR